MLSTGSLLHNSVETVHWPLQDFLPSRTLQLIHVSPTQQAGTPVTHMNPFQSLLGVWWYPYPLKSRSVLLLFFEFLLLCCPLHCLSCHQWGRWVILEVDTGGIGLGAITVGSVSGRSRRSLAQLLQGTLLS